MCETLVQKLPVQPFKAPAFSSMWLSDRRETPQDGRLPTQVRIDNSTSDEFTIIDVFANGRTGLLYTVSQTIFELGLSVHGAKIGTYFDQVVDVFYVRDANGKITDERRLKAIRQELLEAIAALEVVPA